MTNDNGTLGEKIKRTLVGKPRNLKDPSLFHKIALIPILAWIGLGAAGLSSASYGPEEAFKVLGRHTYLALALAVATALTVFIISYAYSRMIEYFPTGGGGYVVATLRGVKESVTMLAPIFVVFVLTHALLIGYGILKHVPEIGAVAGNVRSGFQGGLATLGLGGIALLFLRAFSLGGGTYTGIEAVSNSLQILREPRGHNGKKPLPLIRGRHPSCGRPGGVRRRSQGRGQHGLRLLVPPPLRLPVRPPDHAERRPAHGRLGHPAPPLFPGPDLDAHRHVFDQRLSDLLPVPAGHVPLLHQEPAQGARVEKALACPSRRLDSVPDHPPRHHTREVHPRRLADADHHLGRHRPLLPHQTPLQQGPQGRPGARRHARAPPPPGA